MNVALGTLLILIILSPGFICRYAFLKGPYSRKNFKPTITEDIFWSLIPAFFIQLTAVFILQQLGLNHSVKTLYLLIAGAEKGIDFQLVDNHLTFFLTYTFILLLISYGIGSTARWIVIRYDLDLKYNIFKVNNEWYYLFRRNLLYQDVDFIQLDVLVHSQKGTTLYSGILDDYFLNKEGGIDRLYLLQVTRDRDYYMPGDYFVVFGKDIFNLNLTYVTLDKSD